MTGEVPRLLCPSAEVGNRSRRTSEKGPSHELPLRNGPEGELCPSPHTSTNSRLGPRTHRDPLPLHTPSGKGPGTSPAPLPHHFPPPHLHRVSFLETHHTQPPTPTVPRGVDPPEPSRRGPSPRLLKVDTPETDPQRETERFLSSVDLPSRTYRTPVPLMSAFGGPCLGVPDLSGRDKEGRQVETWILGTPKDTHPHKQSPLKPERTGGRGLRPRGGDE